MLINKSHLEPKKIDESDSKLVRKRHKREFSLITTEGFKDIERIMPELNPDSDYHVINYGTWSMHHFLFFLLKKYCGPSNVWITTWSINENVIQSMIGQKNTGLIKDIHFLFDFRVKKYRPAAFFLAERNFVTKIASCHAKVTVIQGEFMDITIIGSANYTRNNRIETMVVFPGKEIAKLHKEWIHAKIINTL